MATRATKTKKESTVNAPWEPGTVYLKNINPKGFSITEHACWNKTLFVKAAHAAALDAGTLVEQVTEADYLAYKKGGAK